MAKDTPKDSPIPTGADALAELVKQQAAQLASMAAKLQALEVAQTGVPVAPPQQKHTGTFIIGPSRHYRGGVLYSPGDRITVTDEEVPSDWVRVEGEPPAPPVVPPPSDPSKLPNSMRPAETATP